MVFVLPQAVADNADEPQECDSGKRDKVKRNPDRVAVSRLDQPSTRRG